MKSACTPFENWVWLNSVPQFIGALGVAEGLRHLQGVGPTEKFKFFAPVFLSGALRQFFPEAVARKASAASTASSRCLHGGGGN